MSMFGSFSSWLRAKLKKEQKAKILILGLDNSGKTTIIKSIMGQDVNDIAPTLGFTINNIIHKEFFYI